MVLNRSPGSSYPNSTSHKINTIIRGAKGGNAFIYRGREENEFMKRNITLKENDEEVKIETEETKAKCDVKDMKEEKDMK